MYVLTPQTQVALHAFRERVAELNGVNNLSAPFEVAPQPEQRLVEAYQKSTDFLQRINVVLVRDAHGQKLGLGSSAPIASTTDTRIQPRRPILTSVMIGEWLTTGRIFLIFRCVWQI